MYQKRNGILAEIPKHIRQHLFSHPRSGLSVAQYCKKHSISTWSFYRWRQRYQSKRSMPSGKQFSFAELGMLEHIGVICDIRFPTGVSVSVRRGASESEITAVLNLFSVQQPC